PRSTPATKGLPAISFSFYLLRYNRPQQVTAMRQLLLGLIFLTALSGQSSDLILYNGKFVTLWDGHPEAQAVAIRAGRFLAVGSNEEVRRLAAASTRQIDLRGRTVLPGL